MKNYVQEGNFLEITAAKPCKSGDLYVEGSLVGVAVTDSDNALFSIATRGVFDLPKAKEALKVGQKVYSKDGKTITAEDKETTYIGICLSNNEPSEPVARIKLG
jgi:predicted RecA/RadA family phage recombinase